MAIKICPQCQTPIPTEAAAGLCPRCVFASLGPPADETQPTGLTAGRAVDFAQTADVEGERFGDYELVRRVAQGGMGVVYQARQISAHRTVALKMILTGRHATLDEVRRFRTEAEATANLDHPHIVPIYDVGQVHGQPYFSMKWVEGQNLAEEIKSRPIAPSRAVALIVLMSRAVHHAHQRGVLHRDLKPTNILIDQQGGPHLTDFGLAKLVQLDSSLTHTNAVVGTPAYMSPEQAAGKNKEVTTATDIYSLGAILFELLTLQPPFSGETTLEVLRRVIEEEPKCPRVLNKAVPQDLATICLKCLDKKPERRYGTAEQLGADLERWQRHEPILARPSSRSERIAKWVRRHPAIASLLFIVLVVTGTGAAGVLWQWGQAEQARTRAEQSSRETSNTVSRLRLQLAEDAHERGKPGVQLSYLAGVLRQQPTNQLAIDRLLSALGQRDYLLPACPPMVHLGDVTHAEFSRDGSRLVTSSEMRVMVYDTRTGHIVAGPMVHRAGVRMAHFTPDAKRLLTCSSERVARFWDAEPGAPDKKRLIAELGGHTNLLVCAVLDRAGRRALTASQDGTVQIWDVTGDPHAVQRLRHASNVVWATFAPDGRQVLTASSDRSAQLWDAASGERAVPPLMHSGPVSFGVFSENGRITATVSGQAVYLWDAATGQPLGRPLVHNSPVNCVAFSPDGARLASGTGHAALGFATDGWIWGANPTEWSVLAGPLHHDGPVDAVEFSPDGLTLLTASWDQTARLWDAHTGQPLVEPFQHKGPILHAAFSPDGGRIVTTSRDKLAVIWNLRLGRSENLWFKHAAPVASAEFPPDGRTLVTAGDDGVVTAWDTVTGRLKWRNPTGGHLARLAPDGVRVMTAVGDHRLRLWHTDTGRLLAESAPLPKPVSSLEWSQSGGRVLAVLPPTNMVVFDLGNQFGTPRFYAQSHRICSARLSANGQRLVTAGYDGVARVWDAGGTNLIMDQLFHRDAALAISPGLLLNFYQAVRLDAEHMPDRILNSSSNASVVEVPAWFAEQADSRMWVGKTQFNRATLPNPEVGDYLRQSFANPNFPMLWAEFSSNGARLVTASVDGLAQLWNGTNWQVQCSFYHGGPILHAEFSLDGRRLVTASGDRTARLWNTARGESVTEPLQHAAPVLSAHFSRDGRKVVTATLNHTLRVWDADTGLPLTDPLAHPATIREAAFSQDGQRLVSSSEDGFARVFELLSPRGPVTPQFLAMAEALAGVKNLAGMAESRGALQLANVAEQRRRSRDTNFFSVWSRWLMSDSPAAAFRPDGEFTQGEYVAHLLGNGDLSSVKQAVRLAPTNGIALARLALLTARQSPAANPRRVAEARWWIHRAMELAPADPEVSQLRQELEDSLRP